MDRRLDPENNQTDYSLVKEELQRFREELERELDLKSLVEIDAEYESWRQKAEECLRERGDCWEDTAECLVSEMTDILRYKLKQLADFDRALERDDDVRRDYLRRWFPGNEG